jgi:hypothetical protein
MFSLIDLNCWRLSWRGRREDAIKSFQRLRGKSTSAEMIAGDVDILSHFDANAGKGSWRDVFSQAISIFFLLVVIENAVKLVCTTFISVVVSGAGRRPILLILSAVDKALLEKNLMGH